jgi:hypothetical protein
MKWYSRPFCSPGLGARVVKEIESLMAGSCASRALTKVDFPAPDGAATMNRLPEDACVWDIVILANDGLSEVAKTGSASTPGNRVKF